MAGSSSTKFRQGLEARIFLTSDVDDGGEANSISNSNSNANANANANANSKRSNSNSNSNANSNSNSNANAARHKKEVEKAAFLIYFFRYFKSFLTVVDVLNIFLDPKI